jgi:hypothetical protein
MSGPEATLVARNENLGGDLMHTHEILDLMEYWKHCHECGALLVAVPGGAICPHCGFELEDPEDAAVLAFRKGAGKTENGLRTPDDWPEDIFEEVA